MPIIPIEEINLLHSNVCQAISDPSASNTLRAQRTTYERYRLAQSCIRHNDHFTSPGYAAPTLISFCGSRGVSVVYRLADPRIIAALDLMRQILHDVLEHQSDMMNKRDE